MILGGEREILREEDQSSIRLRSAQSHVRTGQKPVLGMSEVHLKERPHFASFSWAVPKTEEVVGHDRLRPEKLPPLMSNTSTRRILCRSPSISGDTQRAFSLALRPPTFPPCNPSRK